jgi:hypothetical protein
LECYLWNNGFFLQWGYYTKICELRFLLNLHKHLDCNCNTLTIFQYNQSIFCLMQDAHPLLHMNSNLVFANKIQIIYKYIYLHTFFPNANGQYPWRLKSCKCLLVT